MGGEEVSYLETHKAIVSATVNTPGRFVPILEIQAFAPALSLHSIESNLRGMADVGAVSVTAGGMLTRARFDGLIWRLPDGSFATFADANRYVSNNLAAILAEGYTAEPCS